MAFGHLRACNLSPSHVSHEHAYHQLILATSGVTDLRIEHRGERITRDLGCLIPSAHHHEYEGDGQNRTLVLDIPLAGVAAVAYGGELERLFEKPLFFPVSPQLQQLAHSLMRQLEQTPRLQGEIATLLVRSLYSQLFGDEPAMKTRETTRRLKGRDRVDLDRLDRFIDVHLADPISVDALARLSALSPGHFHACFRDLTGLTPLAYVQRRRLSHARSLVLDTGVALGSVAELVGFADQASFSRAFRRRFGESPSGARQRNRRR